MIDLDGMIEEITNHVSNKWIVVLRSMNKKLNKFKFVEKMLHHDQGSLNDYRCGSSSLCFLFDSNISSLSLDLFLERRRKDEISRVEDFNDKKNALMKMINICGKAHLAFARYVNRGTPIEGGVLTLTLVGLNKGITGRNPRAFVLCLWSHCILLLISMTHSGSVKITIYFWVIFYHIW